VPPGEPAPRVRANPGGAMLLYDQPRDRPSLLNLDPSLTARGIKRFDKSNWHVHLLADSPTPMG
jgi:hypothetical protein